MPKGFYSNQAPDRRRAVRLLPQCHLCKLDKGCRSPNMPVTGEGRKKILLLGEAPGCLAGDTRIYLVKSPYKMPIRYLVGQDGFRVFSYRVWKGDWVQGVVKKVWRTGERHVFEVAYRLENRKGHIWSILATEDHLFLRDDDEYVSVENGLREGDYLKSFTGTPMRVRSITYVGKDEVFDMEMRGVRNFVANGVVVHNSSEDMQNRQFCGASGRLLEDSLRRYGVDMRRDAWLANSAACRPPRNELPEKTIEYCRPNVINAVQELQPEVIVPLGTSAVKSLLGWLWKAEVGSISRWVGWRVPYIRLNSWICPVYHPSYVLRNEDPFDRHLNVSRKIFERDLRRVSRLRGRPHESPPDYKKKLRIIHDSGQAATEIRRFLTSRVPVAFDYENDRLSPYSDDAEIVSCALSDGETAVAYPWHGEAVTATREFLLSPVPKIATQLKHEAKWTRKDLGCGVRNWWLDTLLAAHVLDNRPMIASIKFQAFVLLGVDSWNDHIEPYLKGKGSNGRNRIREIPVDRLLEYNALDALYEWHVAMIQARELGLSY